MIRTQIYLTKEENGALSLLAQLEKKTKSQLIRQILDRSLKMNSGQRAGQTARRALGAWGRSSARTHLKNLRKLW